MIFTNKLSILHSDLNIHIEYISKRKKNNNMIQRIGNEIKIFIHRYMKLIDK